MNRPHRYTEEEHRFLRRTIPGRGYEETRKAFTEEFGWEISRSQLKAYIGNHHMGSGTSGRFEKGNIPHNKGKRGTCAPGCEKTWFQKGNIPHNHRPVGSERVNTDGYREIKVAEPDQWELKHHFVWESANGEIPDGHVVIFRDNDKANTEIGNLMLVSRGTHVVINHSGLSGCTGELKDTAAAMAELSLAIAQKKRMRQENRNQEERS